MEGESGVENELNENTEDMETQQNPEENLAVNKILTYCNR